MPNIKNKYIRHIYKLLRLSYTEVIFGSILTVLVLIPVFFNSFYTTYISEYTQENPYEIVRLHVDKFIGSSYLGLEITYIVWAIIGLVLYSLFWALLVILIDIRNNIVISEAFVHPDSFHKSNYWAEIIIRRVLIVLLLTGGILFLGFLVSFFPVLITTLKFIVDELFDDTDLAIASLGIPILWFTGWHILVIVRRLLFANKIEE